MAIGKYISLEEARKQDKLKRFIKEHPSKGDERTFDNLLGRMVKSKKQDRKSD